MAVPWEVTDGEPGRDLPLRGHGEVNRPALVHVERGDADHVSSDAAVDYEVAKIRRLYGFQLNIIWVT